MEVVLFTDSVVKVSGFGHDDLLADRELAVKQLLLAQHLNYIELDVNGLFLRFSRDEAF